VSTLYLRPPSLAAIGNVHAWLQAAWPYAVTVADDVTREGSLPLNELASAIVEARRTVILLAASDVTLLRVTVPPMSAARLKQALPHLVEDQLMTDPDECVLIAGDTLEGLRSVAVSRRDALQALADALHGFGGSNAVVVPAQSCLPLQADCVHAAVSANANDSDAYVDVSIRMAAHTALGMPVMSDHAETIAADVLQTLQVLLPHGDVTLHVAVAEIDTYRAALQNQPELLERITLVEDRWQYWIAGATDVTLNLFSGLQMDGQRRIDWRTWRWPLALAACVLMLNVIGLNLEWWHMSSEAKSLRIAMLDTYRTAYPKDKVIADPLLQMRQKIAAAQRSSGQIAADDFIAMAAGFGDAWNSVAAKSDGAASFSNIEYRDRSLIVTPKDGNDESLPQLKAALATRNLSLSQADANAWQIRIAK
jgi:general secretion pathway protein L